MTTEDQPTAPDIERTEDGQVLFTTALSVGQLAVLVVRTDGAYALLSMDRSKDNSTEEFLPIITRWLEREENKVFSLLTVGELTVDESNPCAVIYHLDDDPLAVVTTYPVAYSQPIVSNVRPKAATRYLHMQHQLLDQSPEAMPKGEIVRQMAELHVYSTLQNRKAHGLSAAS